MNMAAVSYRLKAWIGSTAHYNGNPVSEGVLGQFSLVQLVQLVDKKISR